MGFEPDSGVLMFRGINYVCFDTMKKKHNIVIITTKIFSTAKESQKNSNKLTIYRIHISSQILIMFIKLTKDKS